jgi:homoserine dehydrogenase
MTPQRTVHVAMVGLGNVGRAFLDLMTQKAGLLEERYSLRLVLTGAADTSGAVLDAEGIDPIALRAHKTTGLGAGAFPGGSPGLEAAAMVSRTHADLLLEASAVNLKTGQPGLDCVRAALRRGMGVVLANKGPLVHAFGELTETAQAAGAGLAYSATVCGALPVVNIGRRDLTGCEIRSVRGIFNSTSNSILAAMSRGGTYSEALRQAQFDGIAEADPGLDVEGWDTANKLVIITNSILRQPATLADVTPVIGITTITTDQIRQGAARGEVVKLVATAIRKNDDRYALSVQPEWLPQSDFLAGVSGWEMGIVFDTDIMGLQQFKVDERGPIPTAAAMLRDVINLTAPEVRAG